MKKCIYDKLDEVCKAFDDAIKQIRADIAERKQKSNTRLVADEIVRVYTVEITYVERGDPTFRIPARELTDREVDVAAELSERSLRRVLREHGVEPDDVNCVRLQQFITKWHEE